MKYPIKKLEKEIIDLTSEKSYITLKSKKSKSSFGTFSKSSKNKENICPDENSLS
jgi:hypothetical protein